MTVEWNGKEVLNAAKISLDRVTRKVAANGLVDARRILQRKAKTTTEKGLLTQFSIQKSKYKDGGLLVYCQGPGRWHPPYHASFMELGTYKDDAKPYMRPARKKNLSKARKMYQDEINKL